MTKTYDVAVVESSYEKDGKTKNNYRKVGVMLEHSDGRKSIKLDRFFNPLGALNSNRECWLTIFDQKDKEQSETSTTQAGFNAPGASLKSDNIPF